MVGLASAAGFKRHPASCAVIHSPTGHLIVHPPQVEHHRWTPPAQDLSNPGLALLDDSTRAKLRQMRWRAPSRHPRRVWAAVIIVVLLHTIFVLSLWHIMRPAQSRAVAQPADEVLRVRFISRAPAASAKPLPAPPALPPMRRPPPVKTREPVAKDAMQLQPPPAAVDTRSVKLFDQDGQPLLPAASASSAIPDYVQRLPQGDSRIMKHSDPVQYKATRFEEYFPPPGETAGGAAVRHVVDKVVGSKAVDLPHGVHLKCMTILGIPIPNCMNPPAPPSAKGGDERLSMAPAQPLDDAASHPKAPSVKACIAIYRDGKPLPWGCPVDTPDRAVDAELRARARRPTGQP